MPHPDDATDFQKLVTFFAEELVDMSEKLVMEGDDESIKTPEQVALVCRYTLKDYPLKREVMKRVRQHLGL